MSALQRSVVCERIREQVSLQLDSELSELEGRMLESHIARCPECAVYRAGVTSFTKELREAPLEALESPIVIRRRSAVNMSRIQVGVAAALALAALGLGTQLQSRPTSSGSRSLGTITRFPTDAEVANENALLELVRSGDPSYRSATPL